MQVEGSGPEEESGTQLEWVVKQVSISFCLLDESWRSWTDREVSEARKGAVWGAIKASSNPLRVYWDQFLKIEDFWVVAI